MLSSWNRLRPAVAALAAWAAAAAAPQTPSPTTRLSTPEIQVEVLENAWEVGDEKTYTLLFDRAPFGRQAIRLVALRRLPGDEREAVFRQRITLDLRALGQSGSLEHSGTIRYRLGGPGPYRYREGILAENGYATYRKGGDYESLVEVELDPDAGIYRVSTTRTRDGDSRPLPPAARAILVDLLMLGHWERAFETRSAWPAGEPLEQTLLVPAPLPRFDFHLPVDGPRAVAPAATRASVLVEGKETIEMLGARVEAFRCRIEPPGITLWVSPHGGVLRFDDGRGLSGALEP